MYKTITRQIRPVVPLPPGCCAPSSGPLFFPLRTPPLGINFLFQNKAFSRPIKIRAVVPPPFENRAVVLLPPGIRGMHINASTWPPWPNLGSTWHHLGRSWFNFVASWFNLGPSSRNLAQSLLLLAPSRSDLAILAPLGA